MWSNTQNKKAELSINSVWNANLFFMAFLSVTVLAERGGLRNEILILSGDLFGKITAMFILFRTE